MGTTFSITSDAGTFCNFDGVRINYSTGPVSGFEFRVSDFGLLFEREIKQQPIECFETNNYRAFFKTENADLPFDIFSATFYLLSRYEEYLPHKKDMYGRYAHENSLAFKEGFLQLPLINMWVTGLVKELQKKYPVFSVQPSAFSFLPTYDIDIAFSYKNKGIIRNVGGAVRSLLSFQVSRFTERVSVLLGYKKDPFEIYFNTLHALHQQYNLQPLYFFLVAEKNGRYDKNILPYRKAIQQLIKQHAKKYTIGIHPSWQSGDDIAVLKKEKELIEAISETTIINSRQHYIRFNLPEGYRRLIDTGIENDYSMGYGSINGFRASVASSFFWYDLQKEEQTSLRIHPFCYMEANSYYEQKFSTAEAFGELMYYHTVCKEINGTFISIWHNHMLGSDKSYKGWGELYEKFLERTC